MEDKREFLETKARQARELALTAIASFGNGHVGGSMSIMDTLAVLFYDAMRLDDQDPDWPQRDRLVMSKGHVAPAIYAFLCLRGLLSREELLTFNQNGTYLPSHCDRLKVHGIDMTAGSLGQGISAAAGMAKAAKMDGSDVRVYAVIGDGECQEGEVWEAALFAPHQKLDNLTVLLDYNKGQVDGFVADIEAVAPHEPKWEAFGWDVQRVDGHDVLAAAAAIEKAKTVSGKPQLIVLDTVKGKGFVPFEGKPSTHSLRQGFFSCRRCTRPTPAPAQSVRQQPSVSPAASRTGCCAAAPMHGRSFTSAIRPGSWTSRASVIWRPELRSWTSLLFTVQPEQSWTDWCTFRSAAWRTEPLPARR